MCKYIKDSGNDLLKSTYYTALARERWGSYNVNNINYEINGGNEQNYFINSYP